ncbi:MAG: hypothetical protein LBH76_03215 [Propionibacteriaceae bacterium]|nr:hypothetical protein [Propionibacteriaceae bacterium]
MHGKTRRAVRRVVTSVIGASLAATLAGCWPASGPASPEPSPTASAAADLTRPGVAAAAIADLVATAGSAHAVKVEIDPVSVALSVVIGQTAATWQWRDGAITAVESDTAYVGQAIFDPRGFHLADLTGLFSQAAAVAGSNQQQRLHIVEYADGQVYMTVTTNPESAPVFFRPDGSLVETLDFTTAAGLAQGLAEAAAGQASVIAVGVDPATGGFFVERRGAPGQLVRTLRMPQLPPRNTAWAGVSELAEFNTGRIDTAAIARVLARLPQLTGRPLDGFALTVDRRAGRAEPVMHFTVDGQTFMANLDGVILAG